jgi:hypothetical protein
VETEADRSEESLAEDIQLVDGVVRIDTMRMDAPHHFMMDGGKIFP